MGANTRLWDRTTNNKNKWKPCCSCLLTNCVPDPTDSLGELVGWWVNLWFCFWSLEHSRYSCNYCCKLRRLTGECVLRGIAKGITTAGLKALCAVPRFFYPADERASVCCRSLLKLSLLPSAKIVRFQHKCVCLDTSCAVYHQIFSKCYRA